MLIARRSRFHLLALAAVGALLATAPLRGNAEEDTSFASEALAGVQLGAPIQGELAILIPLVVPAAPPPVGVVTQWNAEGLTFAEPRFPAQRYNVEVTNGSKQPVLVHGGTVLLGGKRDRLLRHSVIIEAGATVEMEALPAESASDRRSTAIPFRMSRSLAPLYLRRKADFGGGSGLVGTFVARNLEFRNPGDSRKSLAAIGESRLLQEATQETRARLAAALASSSQEGVVIGGISAIRGRLQGLTLYGSADLLRGSVSAYLLGATYSAAAISIQAQRKNLPAPGAGDPEKMLRKVMEDAQALLDKLRKANFKVDRSHPNGAEQECLVIQLSDGTRGHAVARDGRMVHLAVYPHDPFENAYYGSSISLPDEDILSDPEREGLAELARRSAGGNQLTESEKRVLERLGGAAQPRGLGGGLGALGERR